MNARQIWIAAANAIFYVTFVGLFWGSKSEAGEPLYPDIVEQVPDHLQIQNDHQREWLRFSTTHINIGEGPLQIRGGGQVAPCTIDGVNYDQCTYATQEILDAGRKIVLTHPAGVAFFHPEHNHWHQSGVAEFKIMTGDSSGGCSESSCGYSIAEGVKITFCFIDVVFTGVTGNEKKQMPRGYFECNADLQGISVGWADEYHQSTPLQDLEVTGLSVGDYFLTHLADPENHWLEGPNGPLSEGEQNNFTWVKFRLSRKGANPEVTVLGHSPCSGPVCGTHGNP
jgi:hypothetical protein